MSLRVVPVNFFDQSLDVAVSPAAVSTLPITNLQSNVRGDVWRSPNLNQQTITGTFGGNVREISMWGIWPAAGSSLIGSRIRVQLWSDVAKATRVYDSGTLDFFTPTGVAWATFLWGVQSWGVDNADRTARLAPKVLWISPVAVSSFQIDITSVYVDTPYFESRRVWLGDHVEAPFNAQYGAAPQWKSNSLQRRAVGGSLRRMGRARWSELRFETVFATEADRSIWADIVYTCDPANEIVLSLFPGDASPKRERDFTCLGSLEALNPLVFSNTDFHTLQLAIVES